MDGVYIIGSIETKNEKILKSTDLIKKAVSKICAELGLNIVGEKSRIFDDSNGVTYCFILSQSHFIVHTWPEESMIFFDIFACNRDFNDENINSLMETAFNGKLKDVKKVKSQ